MATNPKALSTESAKPTNANSTDRAFRVWGMLVEMYGNGFLTKYSASPGPLWRSEIAKLTDAQIESGFARLLEDGGAFPPSLPEFRAACMGDPQTLDEAQIEELAYQLIPSFERETLSRRDLEFLAKRNLERARALLSGEAQPKGYEVNTLGRLGIEPGKAMITQ